MAAFQRSKKMRRQYDPANIHRAYEATRSGTSVYRASRLYGIPESTLRDRTLGNVVIDAEYGPERVFSPEEERHMVDHLKYMADIGYGYSKTSVQYLAAEFAVSCGKKKSSDKGMSDCWFYSFMKRWPDLKLAKPQKLSMIRAKSASKEVIDAYFNELSTIITLNNLHDKPERIYNIDETGINAEHSPSRVVCDSSTNPQAVTSSRSSNITIIGGGNAVGNHIPPYYVFPGKRWSDELLEGAAPGSEGQMSDNGWSNSAIFQKYLTGHFAKHAGIVEDVNSPSTLILYDGHRSHISLTLVDWAKKRNVILFVLPPHTSHITQPLDIGIFGPFKTMYHRECQQHLQRNPGIQIAKYDIARLTNKPYLKAMSPENLSSAFRKAGIHPFAKTITDDQLTPSVIYRETVTTNPPAPINEPAISDPTPTLATIDSTAISPSPTDFFAPRTITKVVNKPRKRFVPPYIGGSLMKDKNVNILKDLATAASTKATSKRPTKSKGKQPLVKSVDLTSSTHKRPVSPQPGPSTIWNINITVNEDSQPMSEEESENCCVCGKFEPPKLRECVNFTIVDWAKCDRCPHWTHLKFCTEVTAVCGDGQFLCPHCQ